METRSAKAARLTGAPIDDSTEEQTAEQSPIVRALDEWGVLGVMREREGGLKLL